MDDPKDTTFVSTYKPSTASDQGLEQRVKSYARLTESGVPESLWESGADSETSAPISQWQTYPKPLREPPLPHSDGKPGDLFRHVERLNEEIKIPEGPLGGSTKPKNEDGKTKIPTW